MSSAPGTLSCEVFAQKPQDADEQREALDAQATKQPRAEAGLSSGLSGASAPSTTQI